MQCKDIPDGPILEHLARHGGIGCTIWQPEHLGDNGPRSLVHAMPPNIPWKLANAKMQMLMRRGLVDGCPCGCRGDCELTIAGRELLDGGPKPSRYRDFLMAEGRRAWFADGEFVAGDTGLKHWPGSN